MNAFDLTKLLYLLLPFLGIFLLYVLSKAYLLRIAQFPLNSFAARQPAQSHLQQLNQQKHIYSVLLFFIPLMVGLGFYTLSFERFMALSLMAKVMIVIYASVLLVGVFLLWRCVRAISRIELAVQAEQGMAHLLSEAQKKGFVLYHDVALAKNVIVPHILVGEAGVFIVNILVRAKPFWNKKAGAIRASYINQRFVFPNGKDKKSVQNTQEMAELLQLKLQKVAGVSTSVKAILTLPGWYLQKKEKAPVIILPVQQVAAFIASYADKKQIEEFTVDKLGEAIKVMQSS